MQVNWESQLWAWRLVFCLQTFATYSAVYVDEREGLLESFPNRYLNKKILGFFKEFLLHIIKIMNQRIKS